MRKKIIVFWNGYCAFNLLNGNTVRIRLNHWDFFESEKTRLQICVFWGECK